MKFAIVGQNMQSLKVDLDEGERVFADSGKLISKTLNVIMTPRMVGGIMGVLKRTTTGASALLTEFEARNGDGHVEVAGVFPGKVFEVNLKEGEEFIAERYAFLAAQETVTFTVYGVGMGAAFFGGEGWLLQKFRGPGSVFIHVVGNIIEYDVDSETVIEIEPGHVAGFDGTLNYNVTPVDNIKTVLFGDVGLFLAKFTGNGRVISHSVSRHKLALEILQAGKITKNK